MWRTFLSDFILLIVLGVGSFYTFKWIFRSPDDVERIEEKPEEVKKTTVVMKGKKK